MKKVVLGIVLLFAAALIFVGCERNSQTPSIGSDEASPPNVNTPTPQSSDYDSRTSVDFPNWNSDFSADGFIEFDRFAWYLSQISNSFLLTSWSPLWFANDYLLVFYEPEGERSWGEIRVRSVNGNENRTTTFGYNSERQINLTAMNRELAEHFWDVLVIANNYTAIDALMTDFVDALTDRQQARLANHNETLDAHSSLPKSDMDIMNAPTEWLIPSRIREPVVTIEAFNTAIAAKNANFRYGGELKWSNGHLIIEIVQNSGWGIAIYDNSGTRAEAFDDTGWYLLTDNRMTYGLALSLWSTITFCDTFTIMEPVLIEESTNNTFVKFMDVREMFPAR
jgi:hypothetical protein